MESPQITSSFKRSDFTFVQDFHQIIELLLNGNKPEEVGKAVAQLEEKFENAKQILGSLPGLQYTKEQQQQILEEEMKVLERKKAQLALYKHLSI